MIKVHPDKLTGHERAVIDAIRRLAAQGVWVRVAEVARLTGQSEQGAARVLSSAVRKDLVARAESRGVVWFKLTARGWRLARPRRGDTARLPLACGHKTQPMLPEAQRTAQRNATAWCPRCEARQYLARATQAQRDAVAAAEGERLLAAQRRSDEAADRRARQAAPPAQYRGGVSFTSGGLPSLGKGRP